MIPHWLKPSIVMLAFGVPLLGGQEPERYPGQHSHAHPPADFFCEKDAKDPARRCECHRVQDPDQLCENEPRDPICVTDCWEKWHKETVTDPKTGQTKEIDVPSHCHCPMTCGKHAAATNLSPKPTTDHAAHHAPPQ